MSLNVVIAEKSLEEMIEQGAIDSSAMSDEQMHSFYERYIIDPMNRSGDYLTEKGYDSSGVLGVGDLIGGRVTLPDKIDCFVIHPLQEQMRKMLDFMGNHPESALVVSTGFGEGSLSDGVIVDAYGYVILPKPYFPEELRKAIDKAIFSNQNPSSFVKMSRMIRTK